MRTAWRIALGFIVAPLLGAALFRVALLGLLLVAAVLLSLSDREVDEFPGIVLAAEILSAVVAVLGMVITWRTLAPRSSRSAGGPNRGNAE